MIDIASLIEQAADLGEQRAERKRRARAAERAGNASLAEWYYDLAEQTSAALTALSAQATGIRT